MCGIAGILNLNNYKKIELTQLERNISYLKHRGPNESGVYIDDFIGLVQTRLSIIDLFNGTQPIHNENKRYWIVFNGEIYNYIELKRDLKNKGHQFYTETDTEVLLHLFEEEQEKCLFKLNGQFVFAIWDSIKKELLTTS